MARKIILYIHSTLNGVITGDPDGDKMDFVSAWTRNGNILGGSEDLVRLFDRVDTILLGHATYDEFARTWPAMQGPAEAVDVVSRLAAKVNGAHKLVVTRDRQLTDLPWGEFEAAEPLTGDDIVAQIQEFKAGDGGDAVIFGSPTLARSLADAGLIDEYHFVWHPVIVEVGERLFDAIETRTDLQLKNVTTLDEGGVIVAYARVDS
jgi:dihydrofolate reductase